MVMSSARGGVLAQMAEKPWEFQAVSVPVNALLGLYLVGGVVHYTNLPTYWVGIVGIFLMVTAGMATVAAQLARSAAVYAVLTTAAAAGWLTYAAATTPYSWAAIGALVAGGLMIGPFFGVLRYAHRMSIEDPAPPVEVEEKHPEPWVLVWARVGYPGVKIEREETAYGLRLSVQTSSKSNGDPLAGDLPKRLEAAAAAILTGEDRIKRGAITLEAGEYANEVIQHVNTADVFSTDLVLPDDHSPRSIKSPVVLGKYIDMEDMEITFTRDFHTTIVGATGSGKSVLLNNLIHGVTRCTDAVVWLSATDKGLPIVGPWLAPFAEGHTKHPLLDWASVDIPESARMLCALYKTVDLRSRKPRGAKSKLDITPTSPAIVAIFEEAPGLLRDTKKYPTHNGRSMTASEILNEVTRLGRSEAVYVVALSQYGTGEMLGADGPKMKVNFGARAGLRTGSSNENRYVFPDDNVALHRLRNPGETYLATRVTRRPKLGRTYALEDDRVSVSAREHSRYRPSLEADIAAGLGADYKDRWSDARAGALVDALRFGAPVGVGSVSVKENPQGDGLPALPEPYKPQVRPAQERPKPSGLPALPPPYTPQKAVPVTPGDVERMFSGFDDLLRSATPATPELTDVEKRAKLVELLDKAGADGARTSDLQTELEKLGAFPARGTFFRWLNEVATQVKHGVWATRKDNSDG